MPGCVARTAFAAAGLLTIVLASSAYAQQFPSPAVRPPAYESSTLAPHPTPMQVKPPADVPLSRLRVPQGFQVELWAHGIPGARMMTRGDKGTIFVGTRVIGRVYAITDKGSQRESKIVLQGVTQPNGVAFRNGSLYVAAINRVFRFDGIEDRLDNVPGLIDMSSAFALPPEPHHNWKFIAFGPDNKLYVQVGAPCNICEIPKDVYGMIRRYNADGSGMEIVARGVRNTVGFDWDRRSGNLWFTDNGRDWMGDDGPEEELNRVSTVGADFGFPYCHANGIPDPEIKKENACAGVTLPVTTLGPHAAALGMRFYTGSMFPAAYRDRIFIARRGSWNRSKVSGYDVVTVSATPDGQNVRVEPFLTGLRDDAENKFHGRPVDVLVLPDGSLLISDEQNGAIYRVTYRG